MWSVLRFVRSFRAYRVSSDCAEGFRRGTLGTVFRVCSVVAVVRIRVRTTSERGRTFMKRFLRILGRIGKIGVRVAPAIGEIAFPHITGILELAFTAVSQAEAGNQESGKGKEKKEQVMAAGAMVAQILAPIIEKQTGVDIDEEKLLQVYGDAVELIVKFNNLSGLFHKGPGA